MRIYFEDYPYNTAQIEPYLNGPIKLYKDEVKDECYTDRIGYLFVSNDTYSGPIFILPKSFLIEEGDDYNVLGKAGVYPKDVIDTDNPENPFEISGESTFLPELGLWLFRSLNRFRLEHEGTVNGEQAALDPQLPEDGARDKDFLSTALELIDFLKDHRNLFTQISLINHSGRDKIDWPKTVAGDPFIEDGEPWYLNPAIKEKTINIDDTLIVLYYSVLKYLRDKYKFPIDLGEVPYQLLPTTTIERYIETGIGSKEMRRIRHKYFRDDLKHLWGLLDSFFTYNISDEDKEKREEHLLVKNFEIVFETMIDSLVSYTKGVEELKKKQDDGKLIDHIFRYKSLIGNEYDIYFIGDSKYYKDKNRPEGVALYKQFTYAKNAIQYHIDTLYLKNKKKGNLRYRDNLTEGYNITPNFFIRSRITADDTTFDNPSLGLTRWSKKREFPEHNRHFEDRLFDRDTLILREFSINLLFVIAAYAGYEDNYWTSEIHQKIRKDFIDSIDKEYEFFILTPIDPLPEIFFHLHFEWLYGKTYRINDSDDTLLLAFEKTTKGQQDKQAFLNSHLRSYDTGKEVEYTIKPTTLAELSKY